MIGIGAGTITTGAVETIFPSELTVVLIEAVGVFAAGGEALTSYESITVCTFHENCNFLCYFTFYPVCTLIVLVLFASLECISPTNAKIMAAIIRKVKFRHFRFLK